MRWNLFIYHDIYFYFICVSELKLSFKDGKINLVHLVSEVRYVMCLWDQVCSSDSGCFHYRDESASVLRRWWEPADQARVNTRGLQGSPQTVTATNNLSKTERRNIDVLLVSPGWTGGSQGLLGETIISFFISRWETQAVSTGCWTMEYSGPGWSWSPTCRERENSVIKRHFCPVKS